MKKVIIYWNYENVNAYILTTLLIKDKFFYIFVYISQYL